MTDGNLPKYEQVADVNLPKYEQVPDTDNRRI